LRPYALQDATQGETLIWLQDPESNWSQDRDSKIPQTFTGAILRIPVPGNGPYKVEWWDTRKGIIRQRATVRMAGKTVILTVPAFSRDIALRLHK